MSRPGGTDRRVAPAPGERGKGPGPRRGRAPAGPAGGEGSHPLGPTGPFPVGASGGGQPAGCTLTVVARVMSVAAVTSGSPSVCPPERTRDDQWSYRWPSCPTRTNAALARQALSGSRGLSGTLAWTQPAPY